MRAKTFVVVWSFVLGAGLCPASAQLSGGNGSSNAANQSFQQQNTIRGVQQQQTFNNNQGRLNSSVNQMNAGPRPTGPIGVRRRRR